MQNLWPDNIFSNRIQLPRTILIEQGKFLSIRSRNTLVVEIKTSSERFKLFERKIPTNGMRLEFIVKAPSLGNYQFLLLTVYHYDVDVYPLLIRYELGEQDFKADDEATFSEVLKEIFTAEKTQKVIQYVISQIS